MTATRSEINVTPLIDVLLVLLIMFMIITPLTPHGLPALLPQQNTAVQQQENSAIVLQILSDGQIQINGQELRRDQLSSKVLQIFSTRASKVLFLKADRNLDYREVAQVIDVVRGADPSIELGLTGSPL
jgi:biopolymer transport protein ExbD